MKLKISKFTILYIFSFLTNNSTAQNYLNSAFDYNSTYSSNTFKNFIINDTLLLLSGQYATQTGIDVYFEKRRINGDFIHNNSITYDSASSYSGEGSCFIKINSSLYCVGSKASSINYLRSYLIKLNGNLDTVFTKTFDLQNSDGGSIFCKLESKDNYLYASRIAQYLDTISGFQYIKGFITKLDTLGNIIWEMSFGSNNTRLYFNRLKINADGSFYILGSKSQLLQYSEFFIIKADSLGNIIWQRTWGSIYYDEIYDLMEMPDGKLLVTGYTSYDYFGHEIQPAYMAMLSADGSQRLWEKQWLNDLGADNSLRKIYKNADGTYHIWGSSVNGAKDITHPFLMTFSSSFDSLDLQYYSYWNDPGAQNYIRDIVRMPDNGYMACGFGWDDNHGEDGWLLRIDSNGCANVNCTPLAIQDSENETEEFRIYPNPANDKLAIQCKMASLNPLESTCKVLDATGREVLRINKLQQNQCLDISELSVGLYVLRVQTSSGRLFTNKFLVSR